MIALESAKYTSIKYGLLVVVPNYFGIDETIYPNPKSNREREGEIGIAHLNWLERFHM